MAESKNGDSGSAAPEYKGKVNLVSSEGDKFEVDQLDVTFCKTTELVGSTIWAGAVLKDGTALVKPPTVDSLKNSLPFIPPTSAADATAVYKDAIMVKYTKK